MVEALIIVCITFITPACTKSFNSRMRPTTACNTRPCAPGATDRLSTWKACAICADACRKHRPRHTLPCWARACPSMFGHHIGRLLASGGYVAAIGHTSHKGCKIHRLHHFEILVGSIALQAAYAAAGIMKRHMVRGHQSTHVVETETLPACVVQRGGITHKHESGNTPEIVCRIRIIKIHAPAFGSRRKCAHHEHPCPFRHKRRPRMGLYRQMNLAFIFSFIYRINWNLQ